MTKDKVSVHEIVTDRIITALEAGTVPWHKSWTSTGLPRSVSTGRPYRGINPFLLCLTADAEGYRSNHWGTYKKLTELGGQVRKGEKSTLITFWKRVDPKPDDEERKPFMMLRYYTVFNVDQADWADGVPEKFAPPALVEHDPIQEAIDLLHGYLTNGGPPVRHGGDAAFYNPALDFVSMPDLGRFDTGPAYYSTLAHELTHSTGAASRLNRPGVTDIDKFASHSYGFEELIAELGAAMLMGMCGLVDDTIDNSAAYISSWIRTIREDPTIVVKAAGQAQRAVDLIAGTTFEAEGTSDQEEAA